MRYSIIIPTFNRKELTADLLKKVIQEKIPDSEILVVDDCSEDQTAQLLANSLPEVRLLINQGRHFAAYSRNRGIRESSAETIVFIDSDITFEAGVLREFLVHLEVGCNYPVVKWPNGSEMAKGTSSIFAIQRRLLTGFADDYFDENIGIYGDDSDFFNKIKILKIDLLFNANYEFKHLKEPDIAVEGYSNFKYYMTYKNNLYLALKYIGLMPEYTFPALLSRILKNTATIILNAVLFKFTRAYLLFKGIIWHLITAKKCLAARNKVIKMAASLPQK